MEANEQTLSVFMIARDDCLSDSIRRFCSSLGQKPGLLFMSLCITRIVCVFAFMHHKPAPKRFTETSVRTECNRDNSNNKNNNILSK